MVLHSEVSTAMNYREPLPDGCPPDEAEEITEPRIVYRLVRTDPPTDCDFMSQRAEKPNTKFNVPGGECQARGLSVFTRSRDAEKLLRLARFRGQMVCKVALGDGAGRIHQWPRRGKGSHHTWWPRDNFDIFGNSEVVEK